MDMLRSKFEIRPGHLSNTGVAQPAAPAHLVIGRDNPLHMPEVVAQSIRGGTDLYFMRSPCFPGEMLFGETEKKKAASGPKTTSTPKPRSSPTAEKKQEKVAQVRTPAVAGRRPDMAAEGRATAGPSGSGDRRRRDSSPAMSLAALDSMVSSLGRTASDTPVRDCGERKRSDSGEQMLICARKSRADEVGLADVAQGSGAAKSRAASPAVVARGSGASKSRAVSLEVVARDSSDESFATASPRDVSRGSRASDSGAASSERKKRGKSSDGSEDSSLERKKRGKSSDGSENSSSDEEDSSDDSNGSNDNSDSSSNDDSDSNRRKLAKVKAKVKSRLADLIEAQKRMK